MNLKKFLSMIMVLSMTAAVFTGCGSSSDSTSDDSAVAGKKGTENNTGEEDSSEGDKEKLTFWDFHTGTEADVIQDMVNAYNQSQDKVAGSTQRISGHSPFAYAVVTSVVV